MTIIRDFTRRFRSLREAQSTDRHGAVAHASSEAADEPDKQTVSWDVSIEKRVQANRSLKPLLDDPEFGAKAYRTAVQEAVRETELPKSTFPETNPFTFEDLGLPPMSKTSQR